MEKNGVNYAVAGGYAVVLHGFQRGTVDVDLVLKIDQKNFERAEVALKDIGLMSRLPLKADEVFTFRAEYIKNKNLVAWGFVNPGNPAEMVDLILVEDLASLDTEVKKVRQTNLRVLTKASLIKMKEKAGRPQDLEDIKFLKRSLK